MGWKSKGKEMPSENFVCLEGHLARDPELKYSSSGVPWATCCVAVTTYHGKDKDEEVGFFDFKIFGSGAENLGEYGRKGSLVTVTGRLAQEKWEKDGEKRSKVLVMAKSAIVGNWTKKSGGGQPEKPDNHEKNLAPSDIPF